jgi:hypothetical protein
MRKKLIAFAIIHFSVTICIFLQKGDASAELAHECDPKFIVGKEASSQESIKREGNSWSNFSPIRNVCEAGDHRFSQSSEAEKHSPP